MIVSIKRFNSSRELIREDKYTVEAVRVLPNLIELLGGTLLADLYIRIRPEDPLEVTIEEDDANES